MIAGIDASVRSCGLALPDGTLHTLRPRTGPQDPARRLHELATLFEHTLRRHPPRPRLAVIEGYLPHARGTLSTLRLAELGGALRLRLFELDIPYVEISPSELKRAATGHGAAEKPAMVAAARALGHHPRNDDEADAALLRWVGRCAYALEHPTGPALEIIAAHRWPTMRAAA